MNGKLKYIVVEDEDLIRQNLVKKIQGLNEPLELMACADNGRAAIHLVEAERPDIIFTDIKMPIMDGLEMIEELLFSYPDIAIVIITSYDDFSLAQRAIRFGVKDYILKPVDLSELETIVKRLVESVENSEWTARRQLLKQSLEQTEDRDKLVKAIETYLSDNYMNEITLYELADSLNYTADYLSKLFKKYNGESPIKFLTNIRVEKAKELLASSSINVGIREIGEAVGYQDQYYFSRTFKKNVGKYPTEFRKQLENE